MFSRKKGISQDVHVKNQQSRLSMMKVAVLGAGINGTASALRIKERYPSIDVVIISKEFSPNTTSDLAAGYWEPLFFGDTPPEKIRRWSKDTYDFGFNELRNSENAGKDGFSSMHGFVLSDNEEAQIPFWSEFVYDFHVLTKKDIKERFPSTVKSGFGFTTVFIEGSKFIPSLSKKFIELGGKYIRKEVKSIHELGCTYDVVVNCTGLASETLFNDKHVYPIRGQIMRVIAAWVQEFCCFDTETTTSYILPNQDWVVLGGTTYNNDRNMNISEKDREWIVNSTQQLLPSLKYATKIDDYVGLRPARKSIRLDREDIPIKVNEKTKTLKEIGTSQDVDIKNQVIHNYGHGGSGITLHHGCALETTALFTECLSELMNSKL